MRVGFDQGLADGLAAQALVGLGQVFGGLAFHHDLADQRIAVGMEAARTQTHHDVAADHVVGTDHLRTVDDAHAEAGQVVIVGIHDARMLGHLAADQSAARLTATVGNAAHDVCDMLFAQLADGDVVEEEQGLGAASKNVVDAHGHQVDAHRVMLADQLGNLELGAHAVRAGNKDRVFHILHCGGGRTVLRSRRCRRSPRDDTSNAPRP